MHIEQPDKTQVHVTRRLAAPLGEVWKAFTEPDRLAEWRWGSYTKNATAEVDLRVGGRYAVYTDANATADGWHRDRIGVMGIYADIVPHHRLVLTVHWDAPMGYNQRGDVVLDEVVVVRLEERDGGTWLDLLHTGIPGDGISATEHGRGIAEELDWLASAVENRPGSG